MRFYTRQRRMPTVIIVSLIDIFAILLIFVIVTTTFKRTQPEVVIKLPESTTASPAAPGDEPVLLSIGADGSLFLEQKPLQMPDLKAALDSLVTSPLQRRIALRADTGAPFGIIIKVLDALKEAGLNGNVSAFTEEHK